LSRMLEREILLQEVREIIEHGEIIEEYSSSKPYPSCLVHGASSSRPLHVVAAWDEMEKYVYVISVYEPDEEHFMPDLKTRKKDES